MYDFKAHKITADDLSKTIDSYIVGRYAARNRAILKSRFIDGLTYEQLAEMYDLSVSHIKNIVYKNEYTIYDNLWFKGLSVWIAPFLFILSDFQQLVQALFLALRLSVLALYMQHLIFARLVLTYHRFLQARRRY